MSGQGDAGPSRRNRKSGNRVAAKAARAFNDPSISNVAKLGKAAVAEAAQAVFSRKNRRRVRTAFSGGAGSMKRREVAGMSSTDIAAATRAPVALGATSTAIRPSQRVIDNSLTGVRDVVQVTGEETWTKVTQYTPPAGFDYSWFISPANPISLGLDYLAEQGAQYQKFRFRPMTKLKWIPTVPTSMPGQVALLWVRDINDLLKDGGGNLPLDFDSLQRIPGVKIFPVWEPNEISMGDTDDELYCDAAGGTDASSRRLSQQGGYMVAVQGVPSSGTPSVPVQGQIGRAALAYDVLMFDLNIKPLPTDQLTIRFNTVDRSLVTGPLAQKSTDVQGCKWLPCTDPVQLAAGGAFVWNGTDSLFNLNQFTALTADEANQDLNFAITDIYGNVNQALVGSWGVNGMWSGAVANQNLGVLGGNIAVGRGSYISLINNLSTPGNVIYALNMTRVI
jgi:hypothetical protein